MSRLTGLLFFCVLGVLSSCKSGQNGPSEQAPLSIIILERTACYGSCPIYKVQLESSGKTYLNNRKFVQPLGEFKAVLKPKALDAVFQTFQTVNWSEYENNYDANVSDLPTTILTWYHHGYRKEIKLRSNYPPELGVLVEMIDQLKNEIDWVAPEK